jgi:hypothetical protein
MTHTPRRPNGFKDRMRRDPTFRAMLEALEVAWPVIDFSVREATDDYRKNIRIEARTTVAAAIAKAMGE